MGKDKKTSRGVEVKPLMGQFADVQEEKQVKITKRAENKHILFMRLLLVDIYISEW